MPQEQVESSETAFKHDYELGQRAVFPAELHLALPASSPRIHLNYAKRSLDAFGVPNAFWHRWKMRHIAGI